MRRPLGHPAQRAPQEPLPRTAGPVLPPGGARLPGGESVPGQRLRSGGRMTETSISGPQPHRCREAPSPQWGQLCRATHAPVWQTPLRPSETETGRGSRAVSGLSRLVHAGKTPRELSPAPIPCPWSGHQPGSPLHPCLAQACPSLLVRPWPDPLQRPQKAREKPPGQQDPGAGPERAGLLGSALTQPPPRPASVLGGAGP